MKEISRVIKQIRTAYNLTQKQFAKKFFITEKTISNYENGVRTPSIDFLQNICDEFGLTLDSVTRLSNDESNPKDLIISKINDKCAIYDKSKSVYLTPHLYDYIKLSPYNYHIVYNATKIMVDGAPVPNVTYTATVDNFGNITEFNDFILAYSPHPFNRFGICVAYNKKENKNCLVNFNGEILSNSYTRILVVDAENAGKGTEKSDFGLYFGLDLKPYKWADDEPIKLRKLLFCDGKEIDVTFENIHDDYNCKVVEYKNIDIAIEHITKYGPNVIALIPDNIFEDGKNYIKIVNAVCEHIENLDKKLQHIDYLGYTLKLLIDKANKNIIKKPIQENDIVLPNLFFIKEKIEQSYFSRQIERFYAMLR